MLWYSINRAQEETERGRRVLGRKHELLWSGWETMCGESRKLVLSKWWGLPWHQLTSSDGVLPEHQRRILSFRHISDQRVSAWFLAPPGTHSPASPPISSHLPSSQLCL